ncbi:glycoside hydrolase family 99-like domain-containing protein [Streptomyces sp. 110]|uniref:Glycoside hydrolase family 99-like domain-containing protein n=1 Tax=Streptomyces endocoffeicus TaxID=2898945 RepID=A0ABS1Q0J5_9ACTN|nr:glycoside hydrolase family 99-like domain-containing protein [Streptomyces endocoffeicus]MBL1118205.1 glycoside hydrolase family 99-like domain-containing protein [Streptomyces endocoffeicus]
MQQTYDVAAYIWPAYHDDPRARIFFPHGMGEWERVIDARPKVDGHQQPRKPLWGYQNEADPRVMEMQIDAAADYGVNIFIYDWYWYDRRPFLEESLNKGYLKARNNHRVKFYLMWANHDAPTIWDIRTSHDRRVVWDAALDREEFERIGNRLISKYFTQPSYYRIESRPVFSIYDLPTLMRGLGGVDGTRAALEWFRDRAVASGLDGLHLQAVLRHALPHVEVTGITGDGASIQNHMVEQLGFDSVTHYQWCHVVEPKGEYQPYGEQAVATWNGIDEEFNIPYFPHVSVGWDNNPRYVAYQESNITGNTPDRFENFLRKAQKFVDEHPNQAPMVTINSWNEWTEASYLQPDTDHGYAYLDAVKRVFG